ncbi:hypothetical protein M9H77_25485 [Catharanthus roseus]|uniref:Uncharacterized protein n=1 Tax=Catharanthus roseus TaxID=4058 RepID=A0ACC0A8A6_CATRO|nr:hypothetical protein M9H77_25485 [Catharanthus roseus]
MGVRLFVIERSYGVWLLLTTRCRNLVPMTLFWGSGLSVLMCPDSLRLPSCARNPHIGSSISFVKISSSEWSRAQQATEILGQEFWIKSP